MTKLLDGNLFYVLLNLEICVAMIGGGGGQQQVQPQYSTYLVPLTHKRHTMPHPTQP